MKFTRATRFLLPVVLLIAVAGLTFLGSDGHPAMPAIDGKGGLMGGMNMRGMNMGGMDGGGGHMHGGKVVQPDPVATGARVIHVVASSFKLVPSSITVVTGENVAIELEATDTTHDFVVDGPPGHVVAAGAGETVTGGLRIDEPGEYVVYCSLPGHRQAGMEASLRVTA